MLYHTLALACALSSSGLVGARTSRRSPHRGSIFDNPAFDGKLCYKPDKLSAPDSSFELEKCPNLEPQTALSVPASEPDAYDPRDVDWRSMVKAFEYIADKEPRYCNFAIRSHFHDAGSLGDNLPPPANVYGADGSLHLDKFEFLQPENAYDAFSLYARTVNTEFARFYGASFADILNVAAFTCVRALGASVDIPEACEAADIELFVGKLDSDFDYSKDAARARTNNLPGNFQETPIWLNFWLNVLNGKAESDKWHFGVGDALALMGSHTLFDNQACTTNGKQLGTVPADPSDKGCPGKQRMFDWTNSYFEDVTSGKCEPRRVSPDNAEWFPTSDSNSKGRSPNDAEDAILEKCTFKSKAGFEMGKNLQCVVHRGAAELGIGEIPEDNDFRFVDWYPDNERASCCGFHCQKCPGNDVEDPYFCPDSPKDTSFWFYTWQDCDLIYSTRVGAEEYCAGSNKCNAFEGGDEQKLHTQLAQMADKYAEFRGNNVAWQTEYAHGHCKLNNLGAIYSNHKTALLPLLEKCKGTRFNEICTTDPQQGEVRKETHCRGTNKPFNLDKVISSKRCPSCSETVLEAIPLPVVGELQPGETVVKDDLVTMVAPIE